MDRPASRAGARAEPSRLNAPHGEVCPAAEVLGAVEQLPSPPLLANKSSVIESWTHRDTSPSGGTAFPETELVRPGPTSPRAADSGVVRAGEIVWAEPEALFEQLDKLAAENATAAWAAQTARRVRKLGPAVSQRSGEALSIVRQLRESAAGVAALAATLDEARSRDLLRAGHALSRRLDVWEQVVQIGGPAPITAGPVRPDPQRLRLCLAEIEAVTGDLAQGRAWREYLLVDMLRQWSAEDESPDDRLPAGLAQKALKRLTQVPVSVEQHEFISSGPVAALQVELRHWAAEPVDASRLLRHLEQYEKTGSVADARLLATDRLHLGPAGGGDESPLAERLEENYRNANLRVAVTEELLDRLMPEQEPEHAAVRDTVLGKPVRGQSVTATTVGVRLLPDPNRARLALEIIGQVDSSTCSTSGPATFYNNNSSTYTACKPMEVDFEGIHVSPAEIEVQSDIRLRNLKTDFDEVPLVGDVVQDIARSQHAKKHDEIRCEVMRKVAHRAMRRIDSEADVRLGELSDRLYQRAFCPLEAARLDPTIIDAQTTERRLTVRLRLAGEDQLGSHTPRPRAPSDSLASLQVHETAINNALDRLGLEGRAFTLPELSSHLAAQLNRPPFLQIAPEHENVAVTFAEQDAVRVALRDGRILLRLSIARLSKSSQRWKDFTVSVLYQPRLSGRSARLVREGTIRLSGRRIATGEQIALRGVFEKTFPRRRAVRLTPERFVADPKLADLAVTQFVIEDGWVGVSLGPQRTALSAVRDTSGLTKR